MCVAFEGKTMKIVFDIKYVDRNLTSECFHRFDLEQYCFKRIIEFCLVIDNG